jgi:SMC interacting uncharacterized protein involved in chromosome segregation
LAHKYHEARSRILKEVFRTLEEMIEFREHISDTLAELKQEAEVDLSDARQALATPLI